MPKRKTTDLDRLRQQFLNVETKRWGANVKRRRLAMNLNQEQLSRIVGCTLQTISKVERGEIVPRDYLKAAIALATATEVDELFPYPTREALAVAA